MCSHTSIASSMLCSALPPQLLNIFHVCFEWVYCMFLYVAPNIDDIYMPDFLLFHRLRNATSIFWGVIKPMINECSTSCQY